MSFDQVVNEAVVPAIPLSLGEIASLNPADVIILSAALVAWSLCSLTIRIGGRRHAKRDGPTRMAALQPGGKVLLAVVTVCTFELTEAGLSSVTKCLCIAGFFVGVGAQAVLSDLLSGGAIRLGRSLKPGDLIEIDGLYGYVCRLALRSISLRTPSGASVELANSEVISRSIVNYHAFPHRRMVLKCSAVSAGDIHRTRRLMLSVVSGRSGILDAPAPRVIVTGLHEQRVTLELQAWIREDHDGLTYRAALWKQLNDALHDAALPGIAPSLGATRSVEAGRLEWPVY